MSDAEKKIVRFLTDVIRTAFPAKEVSLRRVTPHGLQPACFTQEIGEAGEYADDDILEALATKIEDEAQDDADGWGGINRYILQAEFERDGRRKKSESKPFIIRSESDTGGASEDPSPMGLTTQLMRHNEALARINQGMFTGLTEMVTKQHGQIMGALERQLDTAEMIEKILSESHTRELELKKQEQRMQREDALLGQVVPLAGAAGAAVMGKLLPGAKIAQDAKNAPHFTAMAAWVKQLKPEKFQAIMSQLDPLEAAGLIQILEPFIKDEGKNDGKENGSNQEPIETEN